jgi:hypothetical protein
MMELPKQKKDAKKARKVEVAKREAQASRELAPKGNEKLLTDC